MIRNVSPHHLHGKSQVVVIGTGAPAGVMWSKVIPNYPIFPTRLIAEEDAVITLEEAFSEWADESLTMAKEMWRHCATDTEAS